MISYAFVGGGGGGGAGAYVNTAVYNITAYGGNGGGGGSVVVEENVIVESGSEYPFFCGAGGTGEIIDRTDTGSYQSASTMGGTSSFFEREASGGTRGLRGSATSVAYGSGAIYNTNGVGTATAATRGETGMLAFDKLILGGGGGGGGAVAVGRTNNGDLGTHGEAAMSFGGGVGGRGGSTSLSVSSTTANATAGTGSASEKNGGGGGGGAGLAQTYPYTTSGNISKQGMGGNGAPGALFIIIL